METETIKVTDNEITVNGKTVYLQDGEITEGFEHLTPAEKKAAIDFAQRLKSGRIIKRTIQ